MTDKIYNWTDDPMVSGVADCNTDVVNDCLMHLKYENTSDAIQNMYETGQVEKQSRAFNQLLSMRRSTFDKSKFTVVGNPTITDDGVVNGISTSNYININNSITPTSSIKVMGDFVYSTKPNEANGVKVLFNLFDSILGVEHALRPVIANDSLLRLDKSNGATISALNVKLPTLVNGDKLHIEFELTSTKCTLTGYVNGVKYANSVEHSQPFYKIESILVGHNNKNGGIYYFTGSIDLSKFFIIVDGKEVFSGNKTGIDTIKANNYEVVGSPVITDDGIVSGFSGSDYLKTASFSFSNYWKFNCKFNIKNIPDTLFPFLQLSSFNRILLQNSGNIRIFADENNNTGHFVDLFGINTIQTNTNYDLEISYNNNLYYGKLTNLDNNSIVTSTVTSMYYFPTDSSNWSIGSDCSRYIDGSLDLNSFKIYVDNNLVYQPCLKIPYTQSKTGSKIVDVAYRDRVQDMYEQTGVAPYYTIDETNQNFTLPMGEIYGMIERKGKQNNLAIGHPIIRIDDTLYNNEVRYEGAVVSKTTYADLYKICGDKYARNAEGIDTDTQFCLPDFRNRAIWGSNGFGYINAGLPNITGKTGISADYTVEGAFKIEAPASNIYLFTQRGNGNNVVFDASRSSSIYGGSDTVQPPAIKVRVVAKFKEEDYPTLVEGGTNNN